MIRKNPLPAVCALMGGFLFAACSPAGFDEETLLRYARASAVYSEGSFTEAARMLAGAAAFPPALVLKGKAEYFSGDLEQAQKSLRRALDLRPGGAEASLYLARILREKGEAREAEALVEAVLGEDPSDIRALRLAAELSRDGGPGGMPGAAAFLDRAAEASAEAALVFLDRARMRWIAGDGPGALEDLGKTRVLLPRDTPLVKSVETLESVIREVMP